MSAPTSPVGWSGAWVQEHLDVRLHAPADRPGTDVRAMVGLALRRNPRRAHLLVSTVLGKHVPVDPRLVRASARLLGVLVAQRLLGDPVATEDPVGADPAATQAVLDLLGAAAAGDPDAVPALGAALTALEASGPRPVPPALVLGYAETATGLSHEVAEVLGSAHLHSTRRHPPGAVPVAGFAEEHSHATAHLLLPDDADLLHLSGPLVLVDDELSTGRTVRNTVASLHALVPRTHYVVAALLDVRDDEDEAATAELAERLGVRIDVVSLSRGRVDLPPDALERGARLVEGRSAVTASTPSRLPVPSRPSGPSGPVRLGAAGWPRGVRETARHGLLAHEAAGFDQAARAVAVTVAERLRALPSAGAPVPPGVPVPPEVPVPPVPPVVHVLGAEELMAAPARVAWHLGELLGDGTDVRFSTTTRSPVLAVDEPGYAIRSALTFPGHDGTHDDVPRYVYNVSNASDVDDVSDGRADGEGLAPPVVLVVDEAADTPALHAPAGLLDALSGGGRTVLLVTLPTSAPAPGPRVLRGPAFGSYPTQDVGWLLEDLSDVPLEAATEVREAAVRSGAAHYAESLPVEYQPDAQYQRLFRASLESSAARVARAVGVVTELVLAGRGPGVVLTSLARAGTPVGVLMRRWAAYRYGLDVPHYAVSIVRGRGIDRVAVDYLARRHGADRVAFVDGWTGKGAIARQLRVAVDAWNAAAGDDPADLLDPRMAVLADPGRCVELYGTREDFLIPSACLNSTVSGLVSRTVLNAAHLRPGGFHGAKFYRELADADVSGLFLDTVVEHFVDVVPDVLADVAARADEDVTPTFAGWEAAVTLGRSYGIDDVNLVKPGVGETTRVLLRRVPWRVLVSPEAGEDVAHVRYLAASRGVAVDEVPGLPYSCIGLIDPGTAPQQGEG